jgi:hypothetical protein
MVCIIPFDDCRTNGDGFASSRHPTQSMIGMSMSLTRCDDLSERAADDNCNGEIQHVAAHNEGPEFFDHDFLLVDDELCLDSMLGSGACQRLRNFWAGFEHNSHTPLWNYIKQYFMTDFLCIQVVVTSLIRIAVDAL